VGGNTGGGYQFLGDDDLRRASLRFVAGGRLVGGILSALPGVSFLTLRRGEVLWVEEFSNQAVRKASVVITSCRLYAGRQYRWGQEKCGTSTECVYTYSEQAKKAEAALSAADLALSKVLMPFNVNTYPGGVMGLAAAVNAAAGKPLPASLNSALLAAGMSQADINEQVSNRAKAVRPSDIDTNFVPLLTAPRP
jgi:hypothetical protein